MKWTLKKSGICGVVVIVLTLVSFFILTYLASLLISEVAFGLGSQPVDLEQGLPESSIDGTLNTILIFSVIIGFISMIFTIGFLAGFIILGRKFTNKLLLYSSWILIIFGTLFSILNLIFTLLGKKYILSGAGFLETSISDASPFLGYVLNIIPQALRFSFALLLVVCFAGVIISFGAGLYKLKNESKLAEWAGVFEIAKIIPFVSFLGFIALILESIMFFNLSRKYGE